MADSIPPPQSPRAAGSAAPETSCCSAAGAAGSSARSGDRWTPRTMVEFLRLLAATHSVSAAARAVGMSRQSAYKLRSRLKGQAFDVAWDQAFRQSYQNLPYAALDRALNGYEVPHYYKGELIGTSRRYDERLTVALLKLACPSDTLQVGGAVAAARSHGRRFTALLERIAAQGDGAQATAADDPGSDSRADPANPSPSGSASKTLKFRGFDAAAAG